ncbi:MAG TPA: hypothetical protein VFY14_00105 [Streptomyces sp.]|nr:hypothetical protein [Streptomyces sp.]
MRRTPSAPRTDTRAVGRTGFRAATGALLLAALSGCMTVGSPGEGNGADRQPAGHQASQDAGVSRSGSAVAPRGRDGAGGGERPGAVRKDEGRGGADGEDRKPSASASATASPSTGPSRPARPSPAASPGQGGGRPSATPSRGPAASPSRTPPPVEPPPPDDDGGDGGDGGGESDGEEDGDADGGTDGPGEHTAMDGVRYNAHSAPAGYGSSISHRPYGPYRPGERPGAERPVAERR